MYKYLEIKRIKVFTVRDICHREKKELKRLKEREGKRRERKVRETKREKGQVIKNCWRKFD